MNFLGLSQRLLLLPLVVAMYACSDGPCPSDPHCGAFGCTRVPLEVLAAEGFSTSVPLESASFHCGSTGVGYPAYERTTGCGFVTYSTYGLFSSDAIYDIESGALVGVFVQDDIGHMLERSSCFDAAYAAGVAPTRPCAEAVTDACWIVDPSCPDQTAPAPLQACCVDDVACVAAEPFTTGPNGPTIASTLDAICAERAGCPADLATALVEPYCAAIRTGCGLTGVRGYDASNLSNLVTAFFETETGLLVGAEYTTYEARTRKVGGCCGIHFTAGTTLVDCDAVVESRCTRAP